MSAPLIVSIPHRLGREEAVRRLKGGLSRTAASFPVLTVDEERWEGDRMFFRVRALAQAASGQIDVAEDHVRLEVMLPWLLQRFADMDLAGRRSEQPSRNATTKKVCDERVVSLLVTNSADPIACARKGTDLRVGTTSARPSGRQIPGGLR